MMMIIIVAVNDDCDDWEEVGTCTAAADKSYSVCIQKPKTTSAMKSSSSLRLWLTQPPNRIHTTLRNRSLYHLINILLFKLKCRTKTIGWPFELVPIISLQSPSTVVVALPSDSVNRLPKELQINFICKTPIELECKKLQEKMRCANF